jgi:hypothetical protein
MTNLAPTASLSRRQFGMAVAGAGLATLAADQPVSVTRLCYERLAPLLDRAGLDRPARWKATR